MRTLAYKMVADETQANHSELAQVIPWGSHTLERGQKAKQRALTGQPSSLWREEKLYLFRWSGGGFRNPPSSAGLTC